MEDSLKVSIDRFADCAYVSLRDAEIARTERVSELVNADLDSDGHIVGLELLALGANVPLSAIAEKFHLSSAETKKFELALANL
jgi:uncharacterized protein YuzE